MINHNRKKSSAWRLFIEKTGHHDGYATKMDICKYVTESMYDTMTAAQIADVLVLADKQYHDGERNGERDAVDNGFIHLNGKKYSVEYDSEIEVS